MGIWLKQCLLKLKIKRGERNLHPGGMKNITIINEISCVLKLIMRVSLLFAIETRSSGIKGRYKLSNRHWFFVGCSVPNWDLSGVCSTILILGLSI